MENERRLILTKVEASDRMKIYQDILKERKRLAMMYIPLLAIITVAEMICLHFDIFPPPTWDEWDVAMIGLFGQIFLFIALFSMGRLWMPPTAEEMNEIGDEII